MTFDNYLMFILCVLLTLFTLFCFGVCIYTAWNGLIKPIMDRIKSQRDIYWERRYREERDLNEERLRKLGGLLPSTIDAIIPDTVEILTSHDNCGVFEERCMITFTINTTELFTEEE